jgi:putative glutamine amidotransferase
MTVAPLDHYIHLTEELVSMSDGVLIQGGGDIAPERYGAAKRSETLYGIVEAHDEFEISLVKQAVLQDKPLLAICRGLQILNVALGGTLHQDLGDVLTDRESHWDTHHQVNLQPDSRIATALKTLDPQRCHSYHHQAIDALGEDLVVTGLAADGVIEVVEHRHCRWIVGVQWHPEDDADQHQEQQALFDAFVTTSSNTTSA